MRKIICDICGEETNERDLAKLSLFTNLGLNSEKVRGKAQEGDVMELCLDCTAAVRGLRTGRTAIVKKEDNTCLGLDIKLMQV